MLKLIEKCNKNFNILYYIYSIYKDENYSLLSEKINKFKDTFINLCYILKNAGLNIKNDKNIDEKLKKYSKKQSNFIEFIKKEINVEIKDKWYIKKSIQSDNNEKEGENYNQFEENYINQEFIEEEEEEFKINEENKENVTTKGEEYEIKVKKEEDFEYKEINEIENIKINKFGSEKENINNNNENEEYEEYEENEEDESSYLEGYIYNNEYTNTKERVYKITQDVFDEIEVTEIDGINRCINKMKLLYNYSPIYIKKK